jgi:mRNA-degrading endonuclease RelE of RelBE toxin-antitoxin system
VSYRIAYQIYEKEKLVLIIAIGPREKFYEKLLKRIK